MSVKDIQLLGNPVLRIASSPVRRFGTPALEDLICDLRDTLHNFRRRNGFGRGIAAPQIGVTQRVILIDVETPRELINPVIARRSRKTMTLWDDCFSFPDLMVKVRRSLSVEVRYRDREGAQHSLTATGPLSELLQHEIDHINGVLAIDRAVDSRHIIYRSEFERFRAEQEPGAL